MKLPIYIKLEAALVQALREYCNRTGMSRTEAIRRAIKQLLTLSLLVLVGCATAPRQDPLLAQMAQRLNQPYSEIVMEKGPPAQKEQLTERKFVAVWVYDFGTGGGHGSAQNIFGTIVYSQSPTYRKICKIMYFFEDDLVSAYRYEGYCR